MRTAEQLRSEQIGSAKLEEPELLTSHNGNGGHNGGGRRPPPEPAADRGYGGGRLPRWAELLLWTGLVAIALLTGVVIGQAIAPRERRREEA